MTWAKVVTMKAGLGPALAAGAALGPAGSVLAAARMEDVLPWACCVEIVVVGLVGAGVIVAVVYAVVYVVRLEIQALRAVRDAGRRLAGPAAPPPGPPRAGGSGPAADALRNLADRAARRAPGAGPPHQSSR